MHVLIVDFGLEGITEEQYEGQVESVAPAFAKLPGLVSKTWLADPETGTYGGLYVWRSREAMEAYKEGEIYKGMLANPYLKNVSARDFAVFEGPSRVTRGMVEAAA
jgi:heme-degrading monooxygenase HmoA